jgi:hypothetical protein
VPEVFDENVFKSLFASPDALLQVMSHSEIQDAIEDGERIVVDGW